jgi:hypothetical protein
LDGDDIEAEDIGHNEGNEELGHIDVDQENIYQENEEIEGDNWVPWIVGATLRWTNRLNVNNE